MGEPASGEREKKDPDAALRALGYEGSLCYISNQLFQSHKKSRQAEKHMAIRNSLYNGRKQHSEKGGGRKTLSFFLSLLHCALCCYDALFIQWNLVTLFA